MQHPVKCDIRAVIIAALTGCVVAWGQSETTPAVDPTVDKILTRLEERAVSDLRAEVTWNQHYIIEDESDDVTKRGEIWYQDAEPVAKFMIHFRDKITGDGTRRKLDERYVFDGRWYTEVKARTKMVTKREVRKADDAGDPYKVGEGVFPMPFGQKKADILAEFDVVLVPPAEGDPTASDHLRLTPHGGTRTSESYKTLDFWVAREGKVAGLPIKVRVAKLKGTGQLDSYITVTFRDAKLNTGFSSSLFDVKVPDGYTLDVETLDPAPPPVGAASAGQE